MTSSIDIYDRVLAGATGGVALAEDDPTVVVETIQADEPIPMAQVKERESSVTKVSSTNLFRNVEAHPLALDLLLLKRYGIEWLGWEHETLMSRIQQDFHTPTVADVNLEKLQACRAVHLVDDFWQRWEVFLPCCSAFNGTFADFQSMQVPDVAECMVATDVANRIRNDVPWSSEMQGYLSVVHRHGGQLCPIPPLESIVVDTEGLPIDCQDVRARWPSVRASGRAPGGDTPEDEQLRRMLGSWLYLESMRKRLTDQLKVLNDA